MARVEFSLADAVRVTGRSKSTLMRAVKAGKLPNAYKNSSGAWKLPVEDLIAAGYPQHHLNPLKALQSHLGAILSV